MRISCAVPRGTSCSPSPQPSPSGRGSLALCVLSQSARSSWRRADPRSPSPLGEGRGEGEGDTPGTRGDAFGVHLARISTLRFASGLALATLALIGCGENAPDGPPAAEIRGTPIVRSIAKPATNLVVRTNPPAPAAAATGSP